ncbi:unnamed protein product [Arctia plantaginis]|uniref:Uncharacterized protein n=1 Tax=Arctia plantaginis TaxID=874455 RepID=A0A8S1A3U7_ARCPL|nr:unnamed protein product [Arctia plantaginis]
MRRASARYAFTLHLVFDVGQCRLILNIKGACLNVLSQEDNRGGRRRCLTKTYNVDELAEFKFDADSQHICGVDDGPNKFVVVGEEVIVEPFRVGIAGGGGAEQAAGRQPPHERGHQLTGLAIVT